MNSFMFKANFVTYVLLTLFRYSDKYNDSVLDFPRLNIICACNLKVTGE